MASLLTYWRNGRVVSSTPPPAPLPPADPPAEVVAAPALTVSPSPPPTVPERPGKPVILRRSDTSITLAWPPVASETREPDLDILSQPEGDFPTNIAYQVRYCREGFRMDPWTAHSETSTRNYLTVAGLLPNTKYLFHVRSRLAAGPLKWTLPSESSQAVATLSYDEQLRINNLSRVRTFILDGAQGLPLYPEDPEEPDTARHKLGRAADGLLAGATTTGVGGVTMQVFKNAYKVYHLKSLWSLVFNEEMRIIVSTLTKFLFAVAKELELSTLDLGANLSFGLYFSVWAAKRERLLYPEKEMEEHADGMPGVLHSSAPAALLDEIMYYFPLADYVCRESEAQIQWVLHRFPSRNGGFRLVCCRIKEDPKKPAFMLCANERLKTAVFVVRGTHGADDIVTDALCEVRTTSLRVDEHTSTDFAVHAGMNEAAEWLVRGDDRHRGVYECGRDEEDEPSSGAGVGAAVAKLWTAGYKKVVFVGHSMGGGVAVLAALKLANRFRELEISVYGYGIPACVDENLAEALKGKHSSQQRIPWLGQRVTCKSIIRRDDVVPRLSVQTARELLFELKETRPQWRPLLTEDLESFGRRLATVWAPTQRAQARPPGSRVLTSVEKKAAPPLALPSDLYESAVMDKLQKSLVHRLVPPGIIVHTWRHNGTYRASVVDYTLPALRRLEASTDSIDDHRFNAILASVRNVRAGDKARSEGRMPPHWESMRDHADEGDTWQVRCRVCNFPVSWHHTSSSEAAEAWATYHCYACGKIVCAKCSEHKMALPSIGILGEVRVCDVCVYKLGAREPTGEDELAIEMPQEW